MKKALLIINVLLVTAILGVSGIGFFLSRFGMSQKPETSKPHCRHYFQLCQYVDDTVLAAPSWFDLNILNRCKPFSQLNADERFYGGWEDKHYFDSQTGENKLKWLPTEGGWQQFDFDKVAKEAVVNGILNIQNTRFIAYESLGQGILELDLEPNTDTEISLWVDGGHGGYELVINGDYINLTKRARRGIDYCYPAISIPLNFDKIQPNQRRHVVVYRCVSLSSTLFQITLNGRILSTWEDSSCNPGDLWIKDGHFSNVRFRGNIARRVLQELTL